jgi:hypothetical protein
VLLSRPVGIPAFFVVMYGVFWLHGAVDPAFGGLH